MSYPGKPYYSGIKVAGDAIKLTLIRRPRSSAGVEGGRFTDSTEDSEPMKPGNRVEDKTLTIRGNPNCFDKRQWKQGKSWTRDDDNESDKSRKSYVKKKPENIRWGYPNQSDDTNQRML